MHELWSEAAWACLPNNLVKRTWRDAEEDDRLGKRLETKCKGLVTANERTKAEKNGESKYNKRATTRWATANEKRREKNRKKEEEERGEDEQAEDEEDAEDEEENKAWTKPLIVA